MLSVVHIYDMISITGPLQALSKLCVWGNYQMGHTSGKHTYNYVHITCACNIPTDQNGGSDGSDL